MKTQNIESNAIVGIEIQLSSKEQMAIELLRQSMNRIRNEKSDTARATDVLAKLNEELDKVDTLLSKFAPSFEEELNKVANELYAPEKIKEHYLESSCQA